MRWLLAGIVLIVACAPSAPPSALTSPTPTVSLLPNETPAMTATPPVEPSSTAPAPVPQLPPLPNAAVAVAPGSFPVVTSLRTKLAVIDENVTSSARTGVEQYLRNIDAYRNGDSPVLPITGRFLSAVSAALAESATPGVKRQFTLASLTVDRHVQKPWGSHAYVDVTVTLVDRDVAGSAPDQWETGKLRLVGERRLWVTDGWDEANGRWFNGMGALPLDRIRSEIVDPIGFYLRWDSWAPGYAVEQWRAGEDSESTPFGRALAARFAKIDRTRTVSQLFDGVTATIERFDTIEGVWAGLATVRLSGTRINTDASGKKQLTPFERRVKVFLFGSWMPEVVDEEVSAGAWLSGGDLALEKIDVDRA